MKLLISLQRKIPYVIFYDTIAINEKIFSNYSLAEHSIFNYALYFSLLKTQNKNLSYLLLHCSIISYGQKEGFTLVPR